MIGRGTLHLSV